MSITTEIKRIQTAKSDIKNVVNKYVPNTITNELLTVYDDKVEAAINKYRNACPTNTSEDGKCADALDVPIVNYQIYGNSEQETTTGKNLLPIVEAKTVTDTSGELTLQSYGDGRYRVYGTTTSARQIILNLPIVTTLPDATIYAHLRNNSVNSKAHLILGPKTGARSEPAFSDLDRIMTSEILTNISDLEILGVYVEANETVDITFAPSLELTEDVTTYEPYTGGAPSPSPNYPQEIYSLGDKTKKRL